MRFFLSVCLLITSLFFVCLLGLAQNSAPVAPNQEPTTVIRSESRLVVVDAVVTDKKGEHLRDLTPAEFHVFEDNKEQAIKSASREDLAKSQSAPPAHIVLLFGKMSTSELTSARANAEKFIAASASPKRVIALINYLDASSVKVVQPFTADIARLKQSLKTLKTSGHTDEEVPFGLGGETNRGFSGGYDDRRTDVIDGRNKPASRSETDQQFRGGATESSDVVGRNLLFAVRNVARILSSVSGRKAVVLMSPLTDYKLEPHDFPAIISACNKANVAIYTVDTRGGSNKAIENTLEPLISGTGGFATNNPNDMANALARITEDQDQHYVITYSPSKSPEDACHALKLTVDRPGAVVRAREQYCNTKPNDPLQGTPIDRELEAQVTGTQPGNISATMQSAYFYTASDTARVHLVAAISPERLNFEKQNGKPHATLNVLGVAYQADGTVAARFSDSVDFHFENKGQVEEFKRHPYRYEKQFSIAPGQYALKVVFSAGADGFAKVEAPLEITPSDDKRLALGSLALCREFRNAGAQDSSLAVLSDRVPMVSQGVEYVPSGTTRFRKADSVAVYFELYEPRLKEARPPTLTFRIRVVDQAGQVKSDSDSMSVSLAKWADVVLPVGWKIPIDKLTPGAYRIEVFALDTKGEQPLGRAAGFEIE